MKYEAGDKLVLEITKEHDEFAETNLGFTFMNFALDGLDRLDSDYINEHFGELQDEAYNKGLNDAWELTKRIIGILDKENHELIPAKELIKIYGSNDLIEIFKNTPQEALAKLKAYDEAQEIKVGDVVKSIVCGDLYLVITEEDNNTYNFGAIDLQTMTTDKIQGNAKYFKKTGKHIDIQSILEQIGE